MRHFPLFVSDHEVVVADELGASVSLDDDGSVWEFGFWVDEFFE